MTSMLLPPVCLALSREWGNALWRLLLGTIYIYVYRIMETISGDYDYIYIHIGTTIGIHSPAVARPSDLDYRTPDMRGCPEMGSRHSRTIRV